MNKKEVPLFPDFRALSEVNCESLRAITEQHPPHASFNHTNIFAWDLESDRAVSNLNGNLLLLRSDYESGEKFLCMLGTNEITDSIDKIRTYVAQYGLSDELRLIPGEGIDKFVQLGLAITEDTDNHEYIYSLSDIAHRIGGKFHKKNQASRRFERSYPGVTYAHRAVSDPTLQQHAIEMFERWEKKKREHDKECDVTDERTALLRLFQSPNAENLIISCLYDGKTIIGLSIDEVVHDAYAIGHFVKADTSYKGIYEFLNEKVAQHLHSLGARFWNWQQDLGLHGLRQLKLSYHPTHLLKRHRVKIDAQ